MRFAVTILSSILLACSVTIANPVHPSATTSIIYGPLSTPNTNAIGSAGPDLLSDDIKSLLLEYAEKKYNHDKQARKCELINLQYSEQRGLVKYLGEKVDSFRLELQKNPEHSNYPHSDVRMTTLKQKFGGEYCILVKLENKEKRCRFDSDYLKYELELVIIKLVARIFGPFNSEPLDEQLSRVLSYPLISTYLEGLYGQSSVHTDESGQGSSTQQQQDLQPSPAMSSRSRSTRRRFSARIRSTVSRFSSGLRMFAEQFRCDNKSD
ncbi:hypothetical protein BATDEDRAFT_23073 [Batrachochytrium dendrobatidis JAM81]|uniref:Uncharacterized protein n=2 Tax=Batrachochytrium dendrobatidis TaxID=109871 RepID=F4NWN0_BATDJ|nr:uncharacterized protein BATDEDRAFT_23073 [Batrachochytrium dendrobatidis JAM81]EGF82512.1 hypothetical protein BATDEDRAFT_23073 [Batrachochytrium dendrobatidis JAM81]KAK5667076.1 hypothetical protein QVD99_006292 [Batrachochytrium dendrobatidis]OAJ39487.1 hypothetical protein BDEG_23326 [Batrachochytrium dendrobatidis JEL423]|eukprot:XP_006676699.1 hypothetical protein BATDEDRAFT_23073 [Batrachochytrium dendrobatidis JAM81]